MRLPISHTRSLPAAPRKLAAPLHRAAKLPRQQHGLTMQARAIAQSLLLTIDRALAEGSMLLQAQHSDVDAVADIFLGTTAPDIDEPDDGRDAFAELVQMAVEADPSLAERAKSHYSASTSLLGGYC